VTSAAGLAEIERIASQVMPAGFFVDYVGQSRQEKIAGNTLLIAFGLAVLIIYLVLAAQFESFRDPFIILMSVPLSLFGAMVFLNLGLATLNIYTQVGLITLIGLITKHGILMVEFANDQQRLHGANRRHAIEEAAKVRLRPILDDHVCHGAGRDPVADGNRSRRGGPLFNGAGYRHRHGYRYALHVVCRADVLQLHFQPQGNGGFRPSGAKGNGRRCPQ
jgi:multidrug efflux pump subunit AcrB